MIAEQSDGSLTPGRGKGALHQVARRFLRLDPPIPDRSESEIQAELSRNYNWNFLFNMLEGASYKFGVSFIASSTILPLFITKLTPTPLLPIGLIGVIAQGGWFLPQLFMARLVGRLPYQKPVVIKLGLLIERIPCWIIALSALVAVQNPTAAMILFLVSYTWLNLGSGSIAVFWQEMVARIFPPNRRGRLFGLTNFIGGGLGVLGAGISAQLLASTPFPNNFFYTFLVAASGIFLSWVLLALTRETAYTITLPHQNNREFFKALPGLLHEDPNFERFFIARLLLALGGMGAGFITAAALHRWQVSDGTVGLYTTCVLGGETVGHMIFGLMGDRFGNKRGLAVGALLSTLAYSLAWIAPHPSWYFVVFLLQGAALGAALTAGLTLVMEFGKPAQRPTYIGLVSTSIGVVSTLAPLLGAAFANLSYGVLFALSAIISAISFVLLAWWVKEPRWSKEMTD
ncbi:MAG: MFS transporter [Anaerolineae bacterium]|jgi:MFS family permease|nr:MFS transporter [Anaerolineae bacterium]